MLTKPFLLLDSSKKLTTPYTSLHKSCDRLVLILQGGGSVYTKAGPLVSVASQEMNGWAGGGGG